MQDKKIEKIIDEVCAFIKEVPIEDPEWKEYKKIAIENVKELIEFLVGRQIIGVRPPWCIGDIPKYPPPFKPYENK
jgi:hypothetical protein